MCLIEGESGTGKERVARALHEFSRRSNAPFVTISLAGAASARLESDLFGPDGKLAEANGGHALSGRRGRSAKRGRKRASWASCKPATRRRARMCA
ncbi:MAG: sigma 54-interacting transcriptional regulator [Terricaulis sp.]